MLSPDPALKADTFNDDLIKARAPLLRYARSLCRNHANAEDLTQTTLCIAIRRQQQFKRGTNLIAWLMEIMRRVHSGERRSCNARLLDFTGKPDYGDHIEAADNPERRMIVCEAYDAMRQLKPRTADMLMDAGIGFTLEDIAVKFGTPLNSVKSHLRRGRVQLATATGGI